ncbi:MAG: tRNA (adenosine(37)-N6)-dimethylallyltransferase MiaA [Legionellaceae bacterium]|nr:tRNA (adenosine(37)-N6)-dimethylallyltransferase MiaA [Legionellaceae bacterium]
MTITCLMGPTATGKTGIAIRLAQAFPFEIISVDSTMVYRGMDIGSATPTADELTSAPHRLINFRDPSDPYSAADFCEDALREIKDIIDAGKKPLLVGGTMLYFKALQQGLSPLPKADPAIRQALEKEAEEKGWQVLHDRLTAIDPKSAEKIHPNDPQRLQRALEVYEITGQPLSELQSSQSLSHQYEFLNIGLLPDDRESLRQQIAKRFRQMLDDGLVEEVRVLYERGDLHAELPAMRAVGYRQVWDYLSGKLSYDEMVEKAIIATGQLAKRQTTWLRSWPNLHIVNSQAKDAYEQVVNLITS